MHASVIIVVHSEAISSFIVTWWLILHRATSYAGSPCPGLHKGAPGHRELRVNLCEVGSSIDVGSLLRCHIEVLDGATEVELVRL